MKRILFICFGLFLITGCVNEYYLEIDSTEVKENIKVSFDINEEDIDDYEDYQRFISFTSEDFEFEGYNKKVKTIDNYPVVTLERSININDFDFPLEVRNCFNDVFVTNTNSYIDIKIDSDNECFENYGKITFKLKTNLKVISSNGKKKKNNIYEWNIGKHANVNFRVNKNKNESKSITSVLRTVGFIFILIGGFTSIIVYRKMNK